MTDLAHSAFVCELTTLRQLRVHCLVLVERILAAQGDHAEPELVKLQHALVDAGANKKPTRKTDDN
jgi:hypothetical protein